MTAMGSAGAVGERSGAWPLGFETGLALGWGWDRADERVELRDTDDTEDSDEEEEEALEEDAEEEEPDSDILWTAEPNAIHGHGKPSREEIEEELEEMESDDSEGESEDVEGAEDEAEQREAHKERAIDAALRMSAGR